MPRKASAPSWVMLLLVSAIIATACLSSTNATPADAVAHDAGLSRRLANASSSSSADSKPPLDANKTAEQHAGDHQKENHPKAPASSTFTGPLIAGTLAIVLIGAVVAFKNRQTAAGI